MADQPVTREKLINADKDVQVIEDFIKKPKDETVTTRFGDEIMTLKGLEEEVKKSGGYFKRYTTLAAANADIANIPVNGVVKVTDAVDGGDYEKQTAEATTLTKSAYDLLQQAKNYADANPMFKQVAVVAGDNTNNFNVPGMYTLSANLVSGQLTNWPQDNAGYHQAGVIFVQGINISGTKLVTQIFFPYVSAYEIKVRRQTNSAGAWESAWSTLSTFEKLNTIFAKPSDLVANNIALLSELGRYAFFGKQFTNAEIVGTNVYSTNTYYVGLNAIHTSAINGNKLKARIWNPTTGDIEYRIFTGSNVLSSANGYYVPQANTGNYSFSGTCKVFPTADNGIDNIIEFDQIISIPANTPYVIAFKHTALATFHIGHHTALSGNLVSRGFNLGATNTAGWALNIGATNPASFLETGFQLLLDVVSSSGSAVVKHIPDLVLPPKIYAIPTYDCNLYLEHLTKEDNTLYEYDITCTKGWHRKRGWWWKFGASEATAEYPLSISVHDKQTGNSLASASSVVKVASLSTNAGTKKVLAIGDSLLVSGDITQQLLDMSVADVMKVELIGTRGTGLNKHEGRGGWTINDYTTAGRTYYQFTVSGVAELPAINATTYTVGSSVLMVQEVAISSGSGTILCNLVSGSAPSGSGTLTKSNAATGDSTIAFSAVTAASGNPFWNGSAVNFANYLSANSLTAPDIVFIQLGVNDTFGFTSDVAVETFADTAFNNLDVLINSIKSVNATIKVAVCAPPVYASQDAFGENYACGQTAWRAKRNIVTYNKKLYERYKNQEASRVYVVGSGVSMDTLNNFPSVMRDVNAFNTDKVYMQTNAVHPAKSGYQQIGVSWFAAAKAI